jgi:hypothetical protein
MSAWEQLLENSDWCRGRGKFPIAAYSEYVPPPWLGVKPYGGPGNPPGPRAGDWGWNVTEYEQEQELRPGLEQIARCALDEVVRLGRGLPTPHLAHRKLRHNPYWPPALAERAGRLRHERYVLLLAVALSRTQDDKGRVRWTLFGASEQGPARAFWRGFFTAPDEEVPADAAHAFLAELLGRAYGVAEKTAADPARAGLRVLPTGRDLHCPWWDDGPLPSWCAPLVWKEGDGLDGVRFLLTFRPFERLPPAVQQAYVAGELHLLPFPGSLVFWGAPPFHRLRRQLPFALQVPLLQVYPRHNALDGLRIPQSGWLHEKGTAGKKEPTPHTHSEGTHRPHVVRTHRWQKVLRHQDEVALLEHCDSVTRALFSTEPDDLGLYNKPMARNAQVWTFGCRLLLNGPHARPAALHRTERALATGGTFGYRFVYPAMRVGPWELYWQRPVAAFAGAHADDMHPGSSCLQPTGIPHAPLGYLTAYKADKPDLKNPVELWPRLLVRSGHTAAVELFAHEEHPRRWLTTSNVRALLQWRDLLDPEPLPASLARALLAAPHQQTFDDWLASLPGKASDPAAGKALSEELAVLPESLSDGGEASAPREPQSRKRPQEDTGVTFAQTAERDFEVAYWKTIALLAHGEFRTKSNADCIRDRPTRKLQPTRRRQLDTLAGYLLDRHAEAIAAAGMKGRAWVGEHVFKWHTDFQFPWMGGWLKNHKEGPRERNIVARIPGRDHGQAVIMADHYDTAYMHDHYHPAEGGTGARLAADGADDNYSATAALLLAAPIFLEMSKAGHLGCDVWLVHLTGEEFPSDCLGARNLTQALVEGTLKVTEPDGTAHDLSKTRVRGLYVSDMIAHNNERNRYVFQMAPGEGPASARLAREAHWANMAWNALARRLNRRKPRRGSGPPRRSARPDKVPPMAHLAVLNGEVRPAWEPRSTLFNTDGQIFSDAGVPAVLFMEDYDISRVGYHDSHDTMANIDLDYGAALAAIVIETVARTASV